MSEAFDELAARVESLEGGVGQYSVQELQRKLETSWQPDSRTFLLPERTAARAYIAGAQSLPGGATSKVLLDTTSWDAGPNFDVLNSRYIVPAGGIYLVLFRLRSELASNPNPFGGVLYRNGAAVSTGSLDTTRGGTAGDDLASVGCDLVQCAKDDRLELYGYNGGGNPSGIGAGPLETFLSIVKVEINAPA